MNITIEAIDHKDQRYNTIGDWQWGWTDEETGEFVVPSPLTRIPSLTCDLRILVSNLKDDKMNCLIAIHEIIEALLCKFNEPEITTEQVDTFDMSHPELEEPGLSLDCPYMTQHLVATDIERMIADRLKVDWDEYEKRIREL